MALDRRTFLKGVAVAGGTAVISSRVGLSSAGPAQRGRWSRQVRLGIVGIHAAVLHTGDVLYYELPGSQIGSLARVFDPKRHSTTEVNMPFKRNIMCSGMSFLPNGRLLATGGDPDDGHEDLGVGNSHTTVFDPARNTWTAHQEMDFKRWYPSNVVLPDGRTLIIGGQAAPGGGDNFIKVMEVFDPSTMRVSQMPDGATKWMGLYPRTVMLADGRVLKAGKGLRTFAFDPAHPDWVDVDEMTGGDRKQGVVVPLAGNKKVFVCGGRGVDGSITDSAEVIDMRARSPRWRRVGSMARARNNHSAVLLPDGTVLIVGGGDSEEKWGSPVGLTELYDPARERFRSMDRQRTNRTYHSSAVLLPDGRVLSAGANTGEPEETTVEFFSPPYLFRGKRPRIRSVSRDSLRWGGSFTVRTDEARAIESGVLMKPGANTHQMNFDQRSVPLAFDASRSALAVDLPSPRTANPPGYYMLFILNGRGVPSVAEFVHVSR
jgi:hypothetical protein